MSVDKNSVAELMCLTEELRHITAGTLVFVNENVENAGEFARENEIMWRQKFEQIIDRLDKLSKEDTRHVDTIEKKKIQRTTNAALESIKAAGLNYVRGEQGQIQDNHIFLVLSCRRISGGIDMCGVKTDISVIVENLREVRHNEVCRFYEMEFANEKDNYENRMEDVIVEISTLLDAFGEVTEDNKKHLGWFLMMLKYIKDDVEDILRWSEELRGGRKEDEMPWDMCKLVELRPNCDDLEQRIYAKLDKWFVANS
jgi:hypothetical protein